MEPHLSRKQLRAFRDRIGPILRFLHRCRLRLETLGFHQTNELAREVDKAHDAIQSLSVKLHYMSCEGSTYRPREDPSATREAADQSSGTTKPLTAFIKGGGHDSAAGRC
jgi:hypothetical protein